MADGQAQGVHFSVGKIPVLIRPAFFFICLFGALWGQQPVQIAEWAAIVLVSVLLHELGHAWTMQAFGFAPRIELHALGGLTFWPTGARPRAGQRLLVSVAGPGIQLALGGVVWLLARYGPLGQWPWVVEQLLWVNWGWALINLLPIVPWDGGNTLDSAIALKWGPQPKVVGAVSMVFGGLVVGAALLTKNILLGYLGVVGLTQGWQRYRYKPPSAEDLVAAAKDGRLPPELMPLVVEGLMKSGRPDQVRELLMRKLSAGPAIAPAELRAAQQIVTTLFEQGHYAETADLCGRFFTETQHAEQAVNAACAFAKLGQPDEAMIWLEKAISAGFKDRASLEQDEDLASLRARPDFQALLAIRSP